MTTQDQERLAQIRAQYAKWEAVHPEGFEWWEGPFLLRILDEALKAVHVKAAGQEER